MRWAIYTRNLLKSLGANVQGETGSVSKIVLFTTLWEEKTKKKNREWIYCSCHCAVLDCAVDSLKVQSVLNLFFESALPPLTPGGFCLVVLKQHREHRKWESTKIWRAPRCAVQSKGRKSEERGLGRLKKEPWRPPGGAYMCRVYHTAAVCLMLWKLIRVGDVGMDMARATRTRSEWWSCQRCHLFLAAERTWWKKKEGKDMNARNKRVSSVKGHYIALRNMMTAVVEPLERRAWFRLLHVCI